MWLSDSQSEWMPYEKRNLIRVLKYKYRDWCRSDCIWIILHDDRCTHVVWWRFNGYRQCKDIKHSTHELVLNNINVGSFPVWYHCHYWTQKYLCVFHTKGKIKRHYLLLGRYLSCVDQVSIVWIHGRDFWLLEFVWVNSSSVLCANRKEYSFFLSDFFPVVFGFLKRLPIIGPILSHPALSRVKKNWFIEIFRYQSLIHFFIR